MPARPRRAPGRGVRALAAALALAGVGLLVMGLTDGRDAGSAAETIDARLPTQEVALAHQRVAFRYPEGWTLRALPPPGFTGVGDGDSFCNFFMLRGAAPRDHSPRGVLAYARARLGAWEKRSDGHVVGPVRPVHGAPLSAAAVERDDAYGARQMGLVAFFVAGQNVFRIECSAPAAQFRETDSRAFQPLVESFRAEPG
jgi:hypothetical protein